eukprot:Hpha_TRINITY_DN13594_c0_g2::TRINITY_DN13594_c0_g2_i1::g.111282::m.111282
MEGQAQGGKMPGGGGGAAPRAGGPRMKWATYALRKIILPSMSWHMRYWKKKMDFDRWLEQFGLVTQLGFAVSLGLTCSFVFFPLLPHNNDKWLLTMLREQSAEAEARGLSSRSALSHELAPERDVLVRKLELLGGMTPASGS